MSIERGKIRTEERSVPEKTAEQISAEAKKWLLDGDGAHLSTTGLGIIKKFMGKQPSEKLAKFLEILGVRKEMVIVSEKKAKIWKEIIEEEMNKRWEGEEKDLWGGMGGMDRRLNNLYNKKVSLIKERGEWENVSPDVKEVWENKKDELVVTINLYRDLLKKSEVKKTAKEHRGSDIKEKEYKSDLEAATENLGDTIRDIEEIEKI